MRPRIDLEAYGKLAKSGDGEFFDRDLKAVAEKESIDLLVLLSVDRFGTIRSYYGFIPLGPPQGFCQASGRLIDLRTHQLMWRTTAAEAESMVPVEGDMEPGPPDYRNLTAAIKKAIAHAQSFLLKDFFAEKQAGQTRERPT